MRLTNLANQELENDESLETIIEHWHYIVARQPFFPFMQSIIHRLHTNGKEGTAHKYLSAMNSLERFIGSHDLMLYEITPELTDAYQHWLTSRNVCMNTVSFYMRILRAVFNRAVRHRLIPQTNPFADNYTGIAETRKRAIHIDDIQRIKNLDFDGNAHLNFARDLFLFSFYCRGMAFVDIAYLTKENITNGYLSYTRQKTSQPLLIRWEPQMQSIVDKYQSLNHYLLPIIHSNTQSPYVQYMRMNKNVCRWLKIVGEKAGLSTPLTLYVARHSWASIAKQRDHPISIISRALGHTSERTTQIYLASLDNNAIDNVNTDILNTLT